MEDGQRNAHTSADYDPSSNSYIVQEPSIGAHKKNKRRAIPNQTISNATTHSQTSERGYLSRVPLLPPNTLDAHQNNITQYPGEGHKDRIWNTSTAEERERIKEFWLGLGESERRGLVRIEKEAVLKKMKEQQKHSCSCTVCGRKRNAIEEELEVLYDAYYEELETYANHQHFGLDATTLPPTRTYGRPSSAIHSNHHRISSHTAGRSPGGFVEELDEADEEGSSDDEDEEDLSDDDLDPTLGPSGGIFNFGNSLTAQGKSAEVLCYV